MDTQDLIIKKLEGYSGIRLANDKPLRIKPGVNLLVGRNGSGKTNLLELIQFMANETRGLSNRIETSYIKPLLSRMTVKNGQNPEKIFGKQTLAKYEYKGKSGNINIELTNTSEQFILENIIAIGGKVQDHIKLTKEGSDFEIKSVFGSGNIPKFDFGGSLNSHLLSINQDRDISAMIEKPIGFINEFVRDHLFKFFHSKEFTDKINELENLINQKLEAFFGSTNKRVHINRSTRNYLSIEPMLFDRANEIQPKDISTGERALLGFIFSLATLNNTHHEFLLFDEPEIHMHDDMIRVLSNEIIELSNTNPKTIILISTHSTALIEYLANHFKENFNLITIDENRNVSNSNTGRDLLDALQRNGVWFSPLMLTKNTNIFIENQGKSGFEHRDFLLKFFARNLSPNIIPIGSSGNVNNNDSFISVFEDILKTVDSRSIGIQDGDVWLKKHLSYYLGKQQTPLDTIAEVISKQKGLFINGEKHNQFYFNFWEIENLYLIDEVLACWSPSVDPKSLGKFLENLKDLIAKQYIGTFLKKASSIRVEYKDPAIMVEKIQERLKGIEVEIQDVEKMEQRSSDLIDYLIENRLWHWLPGKEIKKELEKAGYQFDDSGFDYENSKLTKTITSFISINTGIQKK